MRQILLLVLSLLLIVQAKAIKVSGLVKDNKGNPLPFSSIIVKGTANGTSANSSGYFSIDLAAGNYALVIQHVGFKSAEKSIELKTDDVYLTIELAEQQYELGNVIVKNGEDPANTIVRNAIEKRSTHQKELSKFTTEVYIKGRLQLRDYPKKLLGKKVDFEDGDTSKQKVIFLSETVAKYSVDMPDEKIEVISTKVSGQNDGFGFSSPQIISFYKNNIDLGSLNPRGFISPISENAFNFYRYKFEGSFFENGHMVNRIQVIPKRNYEPCFNGYINIIEEQWRIHSVQLKLYKQNQMQFADTLIIEQLYIPLDSFWVIKQQTILPTVKFLGFEAFGSFVQVYDRFELDPSFPVKFFNSTFLKFEDSANKKPAVYWDSMRPIPLVDVEINDYRKKDSLEEARKDPAYLDSLDRVRNKPSIASLLTIGQSFASRKHHYTVFVNGMMNAASFNTIEGLVINLNPVFTRKKELNKRNALIISPEFRYGFSNRRFNANLLLAYNYGKKYFNSVSVTGGRKVFQFDNRNPVSAYANTFSTLLWERDVLKLYETAIGKINYTKGLAEGFTVSTTFEYQDRMPLLNSTQHKWRDVPGRSFEPNLTFTPHKATTALLNVRWQPGSKYIEYPDRKVNIGSAYPAVNASITKGINGILGSDVDYTKWRLSLEHNVNLKLAGQFSYNVITGGFIQDNKAYLPDFTHYIANRLGGAAPYLQSFQLMKYYVYSNTEKLYLEQHAEYHLNGLLTNKIPGFKKLNWFLVTGNNLLLLNRQTVYGEVFIGLENIFKLGRIDFVQSFTKGGWETSGIRFSVAGMLR